MTRPRNQHYVPELHLKHFTGAEPKGMVWTYDNETGKARNSIPKETGFQRNFYSVPGEEEGQYDDRIEEWLLSLIPLGNHAKPIRRRTTMVITEHDSDDLVISTIPLERSWLDDIVDCLQDRTDRQAHVRYIADWIERHRGRRIGNPEDTITRSINYYCSDAKDVDHKVKHDLFKRVEGGTYRLRRHLSRSDLINIQGFTFSKAEPGFEYGWTLFSEKMEQNNKSWETLTKTHQLADYARALMTTPALMRLVAGRNEAIANLSNSDLKIGD